MDRLQSTRLFIGVVENGSFSLAAKNAGVSQAAVSKYVNSLGKFLGLKLLTRTTRKVDMTEAGKTFYPKAKLFIEQFDHAVSKIREIESQPSCLVRMESPALFGRRHITPLLKSFFSRYPDIVIEHYLVDAAAGPTRIEVDLSIRIHDLNPEHVSRVLQARCDRPGCKQRDSGRGSWSGSIAGAHPNLMARRPVYIVDHRHV
jgi:DNA-binding transcriptional LysR family regulator